MHEKLWPLAGFPQVSEEGAQHAVLHIPTKECPEADPKEKQEDNRRLNPRLEC